MLQGDRVRTLRLGKKYTHQELADLLNMNVRQIARYESGETDATGDAIVRIAEVFQVSTDYLLGRTNDPNPQYGLSDLTFAEHAVLDALRRSDHLAAIKAIVRDIDR